MRDHPYALFIFSNRDQNYWHFINVKYDEKTEKRRLFRRITVSPEERLRTASERISQLDLESARRDLFGLSPLSIQKCHDEAFDVEAVTRKFFKEYETCFRILEKDLKNQTRDQTWAHDYALQFLNRTMFLYFIQRKGWLGHDREFLRTFWESYQDAGQPADTFVEKWLNVLFFEAFNNGFHGGHRYFPSKISEILALAPFLNGGLFSPGKLDRQYQPLISDERFAQIFKVLEGYNFTITEDSPLDKEVAVDPEMIGKVYETLVNVSDEIDERGEAGIFYTPRTEIDLMCRLALVDNLAGHLGSQHKNLLYQMVFSLEPDEKADADKAVSEAGLWQPVYQRLQETAVLDPACGSGSFLVGMLYILDDLLERADRQLGIHEDSFSRKKRIIGQSLYGVDVMEWACHVAELRLWLALVVDADISPAELHIRNEPLLPHFTFKIRCGDSLVQEIGGINLGHYKESRFIPGTLKRTINEFKDEKLKFYNNAPDRQFHTIEALQSEEKRIFLEILTARQQKIRDEISVLRRKIEGPAEKRIGLFDGKIEEKPFQIELDAVKARQQIEDLNLELEQLKQSTEALKTSPQTPFVWDIAFVEVFEEDKDGFDIVIGNPPYVRQEVIEAPLVCGAQITEDKKLYKQKLAYAVYRAFPHFFGYKAKTNTVAHKLDAKSDLYIYFYFRSLSLLNENGAFCFITSNSWLDVGYGADLQEFLLKHSQVRLVLDNQLKRTFASADVNSIIVLLSSADDKKDWGLENLARFVMFKAPFEHVLDPVIFQEIDEARERRSTKEYRLFPAQQRQLLADGCEMPDEAEESKSSGPLIKVARYIGNKWGGKYLRAPDIYWTILEKGKGKLIRLGDIAEVRFGIKTGANEFFYLDENKIKEWGIEEEYLKPVIISPRECQSVDILPQRLKNFAFVCHKEKADLKGTATLAYIQWGETQGFHIRPSCRGRSRWYDFPEKKWAKVLWPMIHNDRQSVFWNAHNVIVDHNLFEIIGYDDDLLWGSLAWSAQILYRELHGRVNLGQGALKTEGIDIKTFYVLNMPSKEIKNGMYVSRFAISKRNIGTISEESKMVDRKTLDSIVFDAISLTKTERDAVYEAVINLVESRLKKAGSLEKEG